MDPQEYQTQSIDCAVVPCAACDRAGRSSWRSRVEWHTEKLRRRARLRRFALRALGVAVAWALALVVVVAVYRLVTS